MNEKVDKAQSFIKGSVVAEMIINFWDEFRGTYPSDVANSALCNVGPLQSMIGLAVKNGLLKPGEGKPVTYKTVTLAEVQQKLEENGSPRGDINHYSASDLFWAFNQVLEDRNNLNDSIAHE